MCCFLIVYSLSLKRGDLCWVCVRKGGITEVAHIQNPNITSVWMNYHMAMYAFEGRRCNIPTLGLFFRDPYRSTGSHKGDQQCWDILATKIYTIVWWFVLSIKVLSTFLAKQWALPCVHQQGRIGHHRSIFYVRNNPQILNLPSFGRPKFWAIRITFTRSMVWTHGYLKTIVFLYHVVLYLYGCFSKKGTSPNHLYNINNL